MRLLVKEPALRYKECPLTMRADLPHPETGPKFAVAAKPARIRPLLGAVVAACLVSAGPAGAAPQDEMRPADRAIQDVPTVDEIAPSPDELIRQAEACLLKGEASAARDLFEAALQLRPDDPRALRGLGRALTARRRYLEADALYRDMEARHIEAIDARLGRARLLSLQGNHEGARRFYKDAVQADPGNLEARLGLAREAHSLGLDRTAVAQVDNLVLDHPGSEAARALQESIHDDLRPRLEFDPRIASDDGGNRTRALTAASVFMAEPQSAIEISYTAHEAAVDGDVSADAQLLTGGVTSRLMSPLTFQARAGAIREVPLDEDDRLLIFGDGQIHWVLGPRFAVWAFAARRPLLDSVPLIDWGIRVDTGEMRLEYRYHPEWLLVADGELSRYSDGNARETAAASLVWEPQASRPRVAATLNVRLRRFHDDRDLGYLDPIHYDSQRLTVRLWDEEAGGRLFWRAEASLGRQSYDPNDFQRVRVAEPEARLHGGEAVLGVTIGALVRLEAFHVRTNDALESAPGFAVRKSGLALKVRL